MKARNPHDTEAARTDAPEWVELAAGRALRTDDAEVVPTRRPIDLNRRPSTLQAIPEEAVDDGHASALSDAHAFSGFAFAPSDIPEPTPAWHAVQATIMSVVMAFFASGLGLCGYVLVKR